MTAAAIADLARRLDRLEAESAIRRLTAAYFELCDRLGPDTDLDALGALFAADAVWQGKGSRYGAAFGSHRGRAAIVAMLARYRGPPAHFALNAHFLSGETIEVEEDHARGRWLMLQASTYSAGGSDLRSARLSLEFNREAGRWRIARFETENLFSRGIDRWDDGAPMPVPVPQEEGKP